MDFRLKATYGFDIYGAELLPTDFSKVTVIGILDAVTARSLGHDVDATQAMIRPYLPSNSLTNVADYSFLHVQLPSGVKTVVAEQWIKSDTVEKIDGVGLRITTARDLSNSQVERIRQFFSAVAIPVEMEVI